jgi:mannose-1-phosphate guanylyltransferase
MTLGIQPNSPNTGYGYIQFEENSSAIKKVKKFTEKPNLETAKKFIESGDYLIECWHFYLVCKKYH